MYVEAQDNVRYAVEDIQQGFIVVSVRAEENDRKYDQISRRSLLLKDYWAPVFNDLFSVMRPRTGPTLPQSIVEELEANSSQ